MSLAPTTSRSSNTPYRFLCDEMLQGLGRWLRAAGYDTAIAGKGETDRRILQLSRQQERFLITRDKKLKEFRVASQWVILLRANAMPDALRELSSRLPIDWLYLPFSRCLLCNTPLKDATLSQRQRLPDDIRERFDKAYYCPCCDKLYWEGGHVQRMRQRLKNLASSDNSRVEYSEHEKQKA